MSPYEDKIYVWCSDQNYEIPHQFTHTSDLWKSVSAIARDIVYIYKKILAYYNIVPKIYNK